jgi:Mg-chelatase subunit ChlD
LGERESSPSPQGQAATACLFHLQEDIMINLISLLAAALAVALSAIVSRVSPKNLSPPPIRRNSSAVVPRSGIMFPDRNQRYVHGRNLMRLMKAGLVLGLLAGSMPAAVAATGRGNVERVEVVFVLDTTGSMGDLIDGAKRKIWSIANTIVETNPDADVAMGLIGYRDRGDDYVVKSHQMTEDLQSLYGRLVKFEADGGDDTPESVNEALDTAVSKITWSKGDDVRRIVFLVGDAPPHMDYPDERQYPAILKEAKQRGIIVNAVQAGDMMETTGIWKDIAQRGNGRYMAIPQNGGEVLVIVSPYDDDIRMLQDELDHSVVPFGRLDVQEEVVKKMAERKAAAPSTQVENSKYYAKRAKKEVVTGGGDLLADVRNGTVELDAVPEKELPEELQSLALEKRKVWVNERLAARQALEKRMEALVAKRDAYVAEERRKTETSRTTDSFDRAVEETIKVQMQ